VNDRSGDADLVRQAMAGHSAAYGDLVRRWAGRIVAFCHAQVGNADAADDLAQESLLRGMRALRTLERPEVFGSWLCGIARRVCLDWLKSHRRAARTFAPLEHAADVADPELTEAAMGSGVSEFVELSIEPGQLLREVETLPDPYRETLMLYYYNDLTYAELGSTLGVTAAAVNARLTKARAMLRTRLRTSRSTV
jgi:RNA polymerase sigma-70 factor (ECF subfamily)